SSRSGKNVGQHFTAYVGPPGRQNNVRHPTNERTNIENPFRGFASHFYVYAFTDGTQVTVRDTDTNGGVFEHSFVLDADRYYDVVIDRNTYSAMSSNGNRPYVELTSSTPVMLMTANFNDNWMAYFHSVQTPEPTAAIESSRTDVTCGESFTVTVSCDNGGPALTNAVLSVELPDDVAITSTSGNPSAVGTSVRWDLGALPTESLVTHTLDLTLQCSNCVAPDFSTFTVECSASSSADSYASVESTNLHFHEADEVDVTLFTVRDFPDSNPPYVEVRVNAVGGTAGVSTLELYRAVDNPDSTAPQTLLSTQPVSNSEVVFNDSYTLSLESTRFYRVVTRDGECSRIHGPVAVQTSSGGSGGEDSGLESNGRLASKLARRSIAREY
ncbi:MAG: hypothetical protein AAFY60_19560, partial [Myxococcota bacterium]